MLSLDNGRFEQEAVFVEVVIRRKQRCNFDVFDTELEAERVNILQLV